MEESLIDPPQQSSEDALTCVSCGIEAMPGDIYCRNCAFPLQADVKVQEAFILKKGEHSQRENTRYGNLAIAKFILVGIALLFVLQAIIQFTEPYGGGAMQGTAFLINGIIYLALGFWAEKAPLPAMICGLGIYGTFVILGAFLIPGSLFKGIVLKMIVIGGLIKGLLEALFFQEVASREESQHG